MTLDTATFLRVMKAAGVPQPHRYIMWVEWFFRNDPVLRDNLKRFAP